MARKIIIDQKYCKGCGYCVEACPKGALKFSKEFNSEGYNYTEVNPEQCIGCGTCYIVCPDYVYMVVEE